MKGAFPLRDSLKEATPVRNSVHPVWSGTLAYRAMFPAGDLAKKCPAHRVLSTPMCVRSHSSLPSHSNPTNIPFSGTREVHWKPQGE